MMQNINIIILAGLAGLATLVGVIIGNSLKKTKIRIVFSSSFAASLMILISIFELMPSAVKDATLLWSAFWVILGAAGVWIANSIIPHLHSVKEISDCNDRCAMKMSYLIVVGLILHDFPEGFAIPSSFHFSGSLGIFVVLATFVHNLPEGYILTIASSKFHGRKFFYKSVILSALATLSGAVFGIVLVNKFQNLNPIFLSLAAGAMLFIAVHELLPQSIRYRQNKIVLFGTAIAIIIFWMLEFITRLGA